MLFKKMQYMQNLTAQERHIVDYILQQPQVVFENNAHELARLTLTSASTVVRLCKKLGTTGYPDFQLKLALDQPQQNQPDIRKEPGSIIENMDWIPSIYDEAIMETRRMCQPDIMEKIAVWIRESRRIDIYGNDGNYMVAEQACSRWNEVGLTAIAHNSANHHYLASHGMDASTVSFIISHTGRNRMMIDIARVLKSMNRRTIVLTAKGTPMAEWGDYQLYTYHRYEDAMGKVYASLSTQYLFDVLYASTLPGS